jgi:lipopolysaccharide transport system permease protein
MSVHETAGSSSSATAGDAQPRELRDSSPTAAPAFPARTSLSESLRDAWRQRRLVLPLGASVLNATVYRTVLGPAWIPIQVGFETIGPALVFGALLNLPSEAGIPYFLFLLVGMMGWRLFQRSLTFTLRSFHRYARLTRQISVPLPLVPVASTAQGAWEFLCYLVFLGGTLSFYAIRDGVNYLNMGPELLFAPVGLLWALLMAIGIGFFTAPIFMRARDVRFILRLVLPFWMYVTPVIYPLSEIGTGPARTVALLNPLASIVELVKSGVLGVGVLEPWAIAWSAGVTVVLLVSGLWFLNARGAELIGLEQDDLYDDDEAL